MDLKTFLENFDTIAEAPNGIQKLRSLILDLAVQGKLAPQNIHDESASELIKNVQLEQENLENGKGRKTLRRTRFINKNNFPYSIPDNWIWITLGEVLLNSFYGPRFSKEEYTENGIPTIRTTDMTAKGEIILRDPPRVAVHESKLNLYKLEKNDFLITRTGSIGTMAVFRDDYLAIPSAYLIRFRFSKFLCIDYILTFLQSPYGQSLLGLGTTKQAQPNINANSISNFAFPLPPIAEQKRVVAKIEELMQMCDRLQSAKQTRDNLRQKLRESAIDSLMNAETDEELEKGWAIVRDNWHDLSQDPKDVDDLRRSVLQLALRGKLTFQDSNDESASILLEKIIDSKKELTQQSRTRKSVPFNELLAENFFELPKTWKWASLDDITLQITDGEHATPPRVSNSEVPLGTAKNVRDGFLDLNNTDYVTIETARKCWKRCKPEHNDILMVCVGATTGRLCLVKEPPDFVIVRSVALIRPCADFVYPEYIALAINSPLLQQQVWSNVKQSAQPCLYINRMQILALPIPPLLEQKRIVAKVDELMQMCDRLEESLRQSQQRAEALAASAINQQIE